VPEAEYESPTGFRPRGRKRALKEQMDCSIRFLVSVVQEADLWIRPEAGRNYAGTAGC
jgi:hypothetical protein